MQEVIVKYNGDITGLGYDAEILNENYAILTVPETEILKLSAFTQIEYFEPSRQLTFSEIRGVDYSCIAPVQDKANYGLTGKGVIVAIIDSGIDCRHEAFRNPDGSTRILYVWDQTQDGKPPAGFKNGTEYTAAEINAGNIPEYDRAGHGTAVAGVAAGKYGAAPESSIIAVKLGERDNIRYARSSEIMRGIKYVYDKAIQLNMPLAVNLSYGTNEGSHDGGSLFEEYINGMADKWKSVIVAASGNEGAAKHHFKHKLKQDESVIIAFTVGVKLQTLNVSLWKNFADKVTQEIIAPNGETSGELRYSFTPSVIHLNDTHIRLRYAQPSHYSLNNEIAFLFETGNGDGIAQGAWSLRIRGANIVDGDLNVWLPTVEEVTDKTAFLVPSTDTTLTIPACAHKVITVGGYDTMTNSAAAFSGRGYTRVAVYVKPDIAAPAVNIESSLSGGGYDHFTGTSMAAPYVTGSAALIMQWGIVNGNDPFMYGQRVKAFLRKGATRDTADYPNNKLGYGKLCLMTTMKSIEEYSRR